MSTTHKFTATRNGVTNHQTLELDPRLQDNGDGTSSLEITIRIDERARPEDAMDTLVRSRGYEDINELASFLINLGHQIGHDIGNVCQLQALLSKAAADKAIGDALASLLGTDQKSGE